MKLAELKQRVYESWECLSSYNSAVIQPENFKLEVRRYGDLRCKTTWQSAYAAFLAQNIWDAGISEYDLIVVQLNFTPDRWDYELRHQVLEQFLFIPGALEFIIRGLEQIYRSTSKEDRECAHGLLAMVSRQSGGTGSIADGAIRRFTGTNAS